MATGTRNLTSVDLKHLRYFVGVVDAGSLSKAAQRMNIAQPALSVRMAALEQYMGAVRQAGLNAEDVEIRKADLEDVLLAVMTQHREVAGSGAMMAASP